MKKIAVLLLAFLGATVSLRAQTTSVSGTITDTSAVAWANGTYSFTFLPSPTNPTANYFQNGVAFNKNQVFTGSLNSSGALSGVAIPDNLTILPAGSQWTTQVCPAATATNGCFRVNITITGASQSITAQVVPLPITVSMQTGIFFAAYNDAEVTGARVGNSYFNLTDGTIHVCTAPACVWQSLTVPAGTIPVQVASISCTAVGANLPVGGCNGGSSILYNVPASGAGTYMATCYTVVTRAATTSSTLPPCFVAFTDADTGTSTGNDILQITCPNSANTLGATGVGVNTCTSVTVPYGVPVYFNAAASLALTFVTTGYASSGATSMQYALHLHLYYLGQ